MVTAVVVVVENFRVYAGVSEVLLAAGCFRR